MKTGREWTDHSRRVSQRQQTKPAVLLLRFPSHHQIYLGWQIAVEKASNPPCLWAGQKHNQMPTPSESPQRQTWNRVQERRHLWLNDTQNALLLDRSQTQGLEHCTKHPECVLVRTRSEKSVSGSSWYIHVQTYTYEIHTYHVVRLNGRDGGE